MSESSPYPEFPFPLPPGRKPQEDPEPVAVPLVDFGGEMAQDRLAQQRRILVSGSLNREAVTLLAAQLMAFDGSSSSDVEIIISSPGGPISDVFPVLDVFDLMRANVNVTAIGSVHGTAVGLVAACSGERRAAAHAIFSLRLDAIQSMHGTAGDVARQAEELARLRSRYLAVLSAVTGQDERVLAEEIDGGQAHTADTAVALGIIDAIAGS